MANSVYPINKGINKSVEFKGLRAQYIWYLGGGIVVLMGVFATLFIIGLNQYICLALVGAAGTGLVMKVYGMSNKYGEHGLMKKMARRSVPKVLKCNNRKLFQFKSMSKKSDHSKRNV